MPLSLVPFLRVTLSVVAFVGKIISLFFTLVKNSSENNASIEKIFLFIY